MLSHIAAHWHSHPQPASGPATWLGGTLPQWLTVAAAVIAFVWTVFIYARSVADKRKEQPRLVYATPRYGESGTLVPAGESVGPSGRRLVAAGLVREDTGSRGNQAFIAEVDLHSYTVRVFNGSIEMISDVWVSVATPGGSELEHSYTKVLGYMMPEAERVMTTHFLLPDGVANVRLTPTVTFKDGAGHEWTRRAGEPVHAMREVVRLRIRVVRLGRRVKLLYQWVRVGLRW